MIKPDKILTRGKLRATPHYHGDGVFPMFRSLGQFSPPEKRGICNYQRRFGFGFFLLFLCVDRTTTTIFC